MSGQEYMNDSNNSDNVRSSTSSKSKEGSNKESILLVYSLVEVVAGDKRSGLGLARLRVMVFYKCVW